MITHWRDFTALFTDDSSTQFWHPIICWGRDCILHWLYLCSEHWCRLTMLTKDDLTKDYAYHVLIMLFELKSYLFEKFFSDLGLIANFFVDKSRIFDQNMWLVTFIVWSFSPLIMKKSYITVFAKPPDFLLFFIALSWFPPDLISPYLWQLFTLCPLLVTTISFRLFSV